MHFYLQHPEFRQVQMEWRFSHSKCFFNREFNVALWEHVLCFIVVGGVLFLEKWFAQSSVLGTCVFVLRLLGGVAFTSVI